MKILLWIFSIPFLFVLPGLFAARWIEGGKVTIRTLGWSVFFSAVLLPPLAFGLAMIFRTTVNWRLLFPLAIFLGIAGLIPSRFFPDNNRNAGHGDL